MTENDGNKQERKILVLEDEGPLRDVITELLDYRGYTVLSVSDGLEGLEVLRSLNEDKPGVIATDVLMTTMHGDAFLKNVIDTYFSEGYHPAVLVMSGTPDIEQTKSALRLAHEMNLTALLATGMPLDLVDSTFTTPTFQLLKKPFLLTDLTERVDKLYNLSQANYKQIG